MPSFIQKITLLLLFTGTRFAMAQPKFSASVSSPQISKNELVQLKLTVENGKQVEQITPPNFKNFTVVSGPNQESGMSMVNGDVKQFIALNYILKPKSAGNFSIAPATARVDGKELRSNAVTIQVSNTLAANSSGGTNFNSPFSGIDPFADVVPETPFRDNILKKGENAADKVNKNMMVRVELDKTACYLGEPVIATYKLYTRLKSESNLIKNPSFNGFSVIDLPQPDNLSYKREKVNGQEYNVYIIRKAQLYPLQSGKLELEPAEIENDVYFLKEEFINRQHNAIGDIMKKLDEANLPDDQGVVNYKAALHSQPAFVSVKPLPDSNVPPSFKGAVGNFAIEALMDKNNFTTDDAGKLKVIISGEGNLQLVNSPEIQWPGGFEAFEPSAADDFVKTTIPVSGRKIIDYSFTVTTPGNYILPPIKFSFFDPKSGKYKTDSTRPISLTVAKGSGKKTISSPAIKATDDNFLNKFVGNRRLMISTVAVLILCGLIFWLKQDKKKEQQVLVKARAEAAAKQAADEENIKIIDAHKQDWLEKVTPLLHSDDSAAFYNELNFALKSYLAKKLSLPIETINKKNITEELDKKNIAVNTSVQLQQLLNDIELQLYTPFAEKEKMEELYDTTAGIIQVLDTYKS